MSEIFPLTEILVAGAALAFGGILKGATGAGAPVLAVPVMAMMFGVELAVVVFVVPNLLTNMWQGWRFRAHRAQPQLTWGLAVSGAIGVTFGSYLLATVAPRLLLLAVALVVLLYIGFRLARPHWVLIPSAALRILWPVGFLAGALQGATGVSAPVSVTYLNAMQLSRPTFIATIAVFFTLTALVQIPALFWLGLLDTERLIYGAAALIPLVAFMPVGTWLAARLSRWTFDRIILILLAVIAIRLMWQGLA